MTNYKLIEERLNKEAKKILVLIKEDYYQYMSSEKKKLIDRLIESSIVIVNQGQSIFKDNTLAHGGRALNDEKIHFYPDTRKFKSDEEIVDKCKKLLIHECFHYFLQPDKSLKNDSSQIERNMLHYYTEGLVEKKSRELYEKHKDEVDFEKANYGFNINFVNIVQSRINTGSNEIIFGNDNYLRNIENFKNEYEENIKKEKGLSKIVEEIAQEFPKNMKSKAFHKMQTLILQDGNTDAVLEKIKQFYFIKKESIEKLKYRDGLEK